MNKKRRSLMGAGAALGSMLISGIGNALAAGPPLDPIPPLPREPTPGKPGDFDFLTGEWRIHHWQPKKDSTGWIEFDGEATVHGILAGIGSVEELRIPAKDFSGMGLRLLDAEKKVWIIG